MWQLDWLDRDGTRCTERTSNDRLAALDFAMLEAEPVPWVALTRDEPRSTRGYVTVAYRGGPQMPEVFRDGPLLAGATP